MESIVLYCKSYRNDVHRAKALLSSILKYNEDSIPFYISVPSADIAIFESVLGTTGYTLITDEEIDTEQGGWKGQQIIKAQFWKLGVCHNYLCLDSDSLFIKPFYKSDFLYSGNIPYTVCHEQKELFEWAQKNLHFDPQDGFKEDRKKVMDVLGRTGRFYDFGPSPVIWHTEVWKGLEENYTKPNNLTFSQLIEYSHSEFAWYGEYLLVSGIIPIYPVQPLFKVFHYPGQYLASKEQGYTEEDLAKNYLGIILQSNWGNLTEY